MENNLRITPWEIPWVGFDLETTGEPVEAARDPERAEIWDVGMAYYGSEWTTPKLYEDQRAILVRPPHPDIPQELRELCIAGR